MRRVFILGSTGSIGTQCLQVISRNPHLFTVAGLSAGGANLQVLADQVVKYDVSVVAISHGSASDLQAAISVAEAEAGLRSRPRQIFCGDRSSEDLLATATTDDVVLNGINGAIGLGATLAALSSGATLALANKESLVAGADLVKAEMQRPGQIVPVDSEHSAMLQCLLAGRHQKGLCSKVIGGESEVAKLILTASGGPFRGWRRADLAEVTVSQALNHPTWKMGPVVTINSATLMNKALELIEAHYLFAVEPENIVAVVHPQSHVHSGVQFQDGSTLLQSSPPTMLLPIALGLSAPHRLEQIAPPNDFSQSFSWDFEPIDHELFPAVSLAREVTACGNGAPAVFNAANEVAVDAFRREKIAFLEIVDLVAQVYAEFNPTQIRNRADLAEVEEFARRRCSELVAGRC